MAFFAHKTFAGAVESEDAEKSACMFEILAHSKNLPDQVLDTQYVELTEMTGNNFIGSNGDPLSVNVRMASFVDQLAGHFQCRAAPRKIRLCCTEHGDCGFVGSDETCRVNPGQAQQLHGFSGLVGNLSDALDSHDKQQLWFPVDIDLTCMNERLFSWEMN